MISRQLGAADRFEEKTLVIKLKMDMFEPLTERY